MPLRPVLRRFARKLVFEIIPGGILSVVGTFLVSQYWSQQQPPARVMAAPAALQGEQITALVRDEHALMTDFLQQERERALARQPLSVKEMKAKELAAAAVTPPRRMADGARDKTGAPSSQAQPSQMQAQMQATVPFVGPLPDKPEMVKPEVVAAESGPLAAPEPAGPFTRFVSMTGAMTRDWANKAIDMTGLRTIPALIRSIPERADFVGHELGAAAGGGLVNASR